MGSFMAVFLRSAHKLLIPPIINCVSPAVSGLAYLATTRDKDFKVKFLARRAYTAHNNRFGLTIGAGL
jgi:hypothetical protein